MININSRTLQAFVELAEVRKFTLAAERCHMTQSALSQAMAKLESSFGVSLLQRNTRSVELTAEGERLYRSAKEILAELGTVEQELRSVRELSQGRFSMAIVPSLAGFMLPDVLRSFRSQHPGVQIRLIDAASARCHELVQQGLVDFSLGAQPGAAGECVSRALFNETLYAALPQDHPLASHAVIALADLAGVEFIHQQGLDKMLVNVQKQQLPARQWLKQLGTREVDVEVENIATLAGLVEAGLGAGIAPECALPLFANRGVVTIPIAPDVASRTIYSSHLRTRQLPIAAARFLDLLVQALGRRGAPQPLQVLSRTTSS